MQVKQTTVWLLEGQSSQRDILLALKAALPADVRLLASHRKFRPEITDCADASWIEPKDANERVEWVLDMAITQGVNLVWAGRRGEVYEPHRARFEAAGVQLITGALSITDLEDLDHKANFALRCEQAGIPVASGWVIETVDELAALIERYRAQYALCIKPVHGIFGQGFWRLVDDLDSFLCFLDPDTRRVNTVQFLAAYAQSTSDQIAKPMLLMPYLPGEEYSIDMVCENGVLIEALARFKQSDKTQLILLSHDVIELARRVVALFNCDGVVNMQTKADDSGVHHVLEINARPSGGIGYTFHSGINLAVIAVFRRLGLAVPPMIGLPNVVVRPLTVSVPVTVPSLI